MEGWGFDWLIGWLVPAISFLLAWEEVTCGMNSL
jgi:hypothetical protein